MAFTEITKENFKQEVLESDKTVLIDFWAVWCGPCNMMTPVLEEISNEHPEVKVCKVNTDQQPELSQEFRITAIPALFVIKDGAIVNKSIGAIPKEQVESLIG